MITRLRENETAPSIHLETPQTTPGKRLEHDPEKACPGLDPGWEPVFGKDHAQTRN
jgi:hypothetical protein